jgi:hypothetical protein
MDSAEATYVNHFAPDGTWGNGFETQNPIAEADAVWGAGRFMLAYADSGGVWVRSVASNSDRPAVKVADHTDAIRPTIVHHPSGYLLAWSRHGGSVHAAVVDSSGARVAPVASLGRHAPVADNPYLNEVAAASGAVQSVVAWADDSSPPRITVARLDAMGQVIGVPTPISSTTGISEQPSLASDGHDFWIAYTQRIPTPTVFRAHFRCPGP